MVKHRFTFFAAFPASLAKRIEPPVDLAEFITQFAIRSQFRDQIGPAELAQNRVLARFLDICPVDLPLKHASLDNPLW